MNVIESTEAYENALRKATTVNEAALTQKHDAMASDAFSHLRATYYRWIQRYQEYCKDLAASGPRILAVGDLHVQNFGTWRDAEGRLVWGIDDFDEADQGIPFASDLVRLAASAILSADIRLSAEDICQAALRGYNAGLSIDSAPFVLDGKHQWLRDHALNALKAPEKFWKKWLNEKTVEIQESEVDPTAIAALAAEYPEGATPETFRIASPEKGLGSLGRHRYFAYNANWLGGPIGREVKASVSPATQIENAGNVSFVDEIQHRAVRSPDPLYRLRDRWVCKPILATTGRIEMEDLTDGLDQGELLEAMGQETANVHRGSSGDADGLHNGLTDLKAETAFLDAVRTMVTQTERDWKEWSEHWTAAKDAKVE